MAKLDAEPELHLTSLHGMDGHRGLHLLPLLYGHLLLLRGIPDLAEEE